MLRLALTVVLAVVAGMLVGPVHARAAAAADPGLRFFEAEYTKLGKSVGPKLWDVSDDARKANLFGFAASAAERALEFAPNLKSAREYLGYAKKGRSWVLDEAAAAKVKRANSKNAKESQKTFDGKIERWNAKLANVERYIAAKYAQIGNACSTKGFAEQAEKAYTRSIALDENQKDARKGLGHVLIGKVWLTKKKRQAVEDAATARWLLDETEYEKGLGARFNKMISAHFRLHDDGARESMPAAMKALETLYAYYLADVGRDPSEDVLDGKQLDIVIVSTKPLWDKWVDEFSNSSDKEWTKGSTTSRSYLTRRGGILRVETAEDVDTRDPVLHHAAHFMGQAVWGCQPVAWLDEGLAYYYTIRVQGTTRTSCLAKSTSGYGNGADQNKQSDWQASGGWREGLVRLVKQKDDTPLRKLVNSGLVDIDLRTGAKSWAVVTWLMDADRDRFISFLRKVREDPRADQVALLQETFGVSVEELDDRFRAYVSRAF